MKRYLNPGATVTLKLDFWIRFLEENNDLVKSLFDFIPAELIIFDVELVPYDPIPIYRAYFANKRIVFFSEDIDEIIKEGIYD